MTDLLTTREGGVQVKWIHGQQREEKRENKILGDDAELLDPASPGPHSTSGRFGCSSSCSSLIFFSKFASVMGCHLPTAPTWRNSVKLFSLYPYMSRGLLRINEYPQGSILTR